jgi:hypothetical protein
MQLLILNDNHLMTFNIKTNVFLFLFFQNDFVQLIVKYIYSNWYTIVVLFICYNVNI